MEVIHTMVQSMARSLLRLWGGNNRLPNVTYRFGNYESSAVIKWFIFDKTVPASSVKVLPPTGTSRIEIDSDSIRVYEGNTLRVKNGKAVMILYFSQFYEVST